MIVRVQLVGNGVSLARILVANIEALIWGGHFCFEKGTKAWLSGSSIWGALSLVIGTLGDHSVSKRDSGQHSRREDL